MLLASYPQTGTPNPPGHPARRRLWLMALLAALAALVPVLVLITPGSAMAQSLSLNLGQGTVAQGGGGSVTSSVVGLIAITTILSVAPGILVVGTAFTRIVVVLSLLRTGLGVQGSPPNTVVVSLALFLTALVMAPTLQNAYADGVKPLMDNSITEEQAAERTVQPFRQFMEANVRDKDVQLFIDLAHWKMDTVPGAPPPTARALREAMPIHILAPAFLISELSKAFQIGFLLFLPFLVIDMVVSSILMGMGMMMMPPASISLPFKLIFFVLVDGWELISGSLVRSFST